jgi:CheY-like chemotaxis protein
LCAFLSRDRRVQKGGEDLVFVIPPSLVEPEATKSDRQPAPQSPETGTSIAKILVVEDDADMREVMAFMLEQLGVSVVLAGSVEEAESAAKATEFSLIISDLGLPGQSGLALPRALGCVGKIPAIALSGYGAEEDVQASRAAGFTEHLVKPVTPDKLFEAVRRLLGPALSPP